MLISCTGSLCRGKAEVLPFTHHLHSHTMDAPTGAGDGEALLQRVESLAEAHLGYSLLFNACEFTGDRWGGGQRCCGIA